MAKVQKFIKLAYPLSAREAVEANFSKKELVRHSLTKWSNLFMNIIQAHGLVKRDTKDIGYYVGKHWISVLLVDGESCALCVKYRIAYSRKAAGCRLCPLL